MREEGREREVGQIVCGGHEEILASKVRRKKSQSAKWGGGRKTNQQTWWGEKSRSADLGRKKS